MIGKHQKALCMFLPSFSRSFSVPCPYLYIRIHVHVSHQNLPSSPLSFLYLFILLDVFVLLNNLVLFHSPLRPFLLSLFALRIWPKADSEKKQKTLSCLGQYTHIYTVYMWLYLTKPFYPALLCCSSLLDVYVLLNHFSLLPFFFTFPPLLLPPILPPSLFLLCLSFPLPIHHLSPPLPLPPLLSLLF